MKRSRFITALPLHAIAALVFAGALASICPGVGTIVAGIIVLVTLILAFLGIVKAIAAATRKRWDFVGRRAMKSLIVLIAILPCIAIGDYIHLVVFYPYYLWVIGSRSEPVRFSWGDSAIVVTDGLRLHVLVYDPTGASEKNVGVERQFERLYTSTQHLIGPFFVEHTYSN